MKVASNEKINLLNSAINQVSNGVVSFETHWNTDNPDVVVYNVDFSCEHDMVIILIQGVTGWTVEMGYGYQLGGSCGSVEELLTPYHINDFAAENKNFPYDVWADEQTYPAETEIVRLLKEFMDSES